MERTYRKTAEDSYPQKNFAHQFITVDDLLQFKKQLLEELLTALKSQTTTATKKWMKSHEVRRLLKSLQEHCKRLNLQVPYHIPE